jgi:hypothetical protein
MGAPGYGIATGEGLPGSRAPRIIDCPRPLPLGQTPHVYQCLAGDTGLDSGEAPALTDTVMVGVISDLIGQTPVRRVPLDKTIP